jgi:hypothetical protein
MFIKMFVSYFEPFWTRLALKLPKSAKEGNCSVSKGIKNALFMPV